MAWAVVKSFLITAVKGYRYFLSPWLASSCRFYPTCSEYSLQCLQRFSVLKAISLTIKRLLRCHPWSAGGSDPIPEQ
ncbi:MAG: membrane protein insertion efficiency factor YidD [Immundisolibacteraceae bacterium]|nr:membrane protein insertion efficiency factor YidD [Immundisolibacteraceae bacterium]